MSFAKTLAKTAANFHEETAQKEKEKQEREEKIAIQMTKDFLAISGDELLALARAGKTGTFIQIPLVYHLGEDENSHPSYHMTTAWLDKMELTHNIYSRNSSCHGTISRVFLDGECRQAGYFLLEVSW
tara:strand:- start:5174 stop:5557 length:384 start_codon:yes stop_codon:yes gene_type:complete